MNVTLQAGPGLGGGTVVNWTNSLRTKGLGARARSGPRTTG